MVAPSRDSIGYNRQDLKHRRREHGSSASHLTIYRRPAGRCLRRHPSGGKKGTQREDRWDFVCRFRDGSGVIIGAFSQDKAAEIVELVVFGAGSAWSTVVSRAIYLTVKDEDGRSSLEPRIDSINEIWQRNKVIEQGGMAFELVQFGDGQMLFKINPVHKQITGPLTKAGKGATSRVKAVTPSSFVFDIPMFDIRLAEFKERFEKLVRLNSHVDNNCQSELIFDGNAITIMLPKRTFLQATTFEGTQLTAVSIEGSAKGITELWFCFNAVLRALNPSILQSRVGKVIREFECKGSKAYYAPFDDFELDIGKISITYRCERKNRTLFIRPRDR